MCLRNGFIRLILLLVISFSVKTCFAQASINEKLKKQLDSIMVLDQKYRGDLMSLSDSLKRDSISRSLNIPTNQLSDRLWQKQTPIDSSNLVFIESVIKQHGYPGRTLVGEPANESAWYVIQHSPKIEQYLEVIKRAAEKKELAFHLYAMMKDRFLMNQDKEQIYGTQATTRTLKSGKTENFIWPIKDPLQVNELRKQAGFEQTVEENAKRLNVKYRIVKLEEI